MSELFPQHRRPAWAVLMLFALSACNTLPRDPVPQTLVEDALVAGIPEARYWGDEAPPGYFQWLHEDQAETRKRYHGIYGKEHNYLALSGGGPRGAFGAGLLAGWGQRGDRPEFVVVSGVSTGALIAPYAFLGPDYDHIIREVYTQHGTADLVKRRNVFEILSGDAVADASGFAKMIEHYLPDALIDEIGREYRRGRELLIGTTNIDNGRPVIWSIGAIAVSQAPDRYQLVRGVIQASASLPIGFPPVLIPVTAGGREFDEMHVDGGVANQLFVYPLGMDWVAVQEKLRVQGRPRLYVIRNSQIAPGWRATDRRLLPIASQSLAGLMRNQGLGDLYRVYLGARRDRIDFNLAYIPADFVDESDEPFDPQTMKTLYTLGYRLGVGGYDWEKTPPGVQPETVPEEVEEALPEGAEEEHPQPRSPGEIWGN